MLALAGGDRLDFDLALLSVEYVDLNRPGAIPRERLAALRGLSEVRAVRPLVTKTFWPFSTKLSPSGVAVV